MFSRIDVIWKKACAGGHMTDEKRHLDRKDSLILGNLFFSCYLKEIFEEISLDLYG